MIKEGTLNNIVISINENRSVQYKYKLFTEVINYSQAEDGIRYTHRLSVVNIHLGVQLNVMISTS